MGGMPKLNDYIEKYIAITRMDDPDRLVPSDLEIGEGWCLTPEEREEACRRMKPRSAEFQRISPDEECREVARVLSSVSEWAYKRARQESCNYHPTGENEDGPDAWPSCLSVRKGSALGMALWTASQFSNSVHVSESRLNAGVGLRRTLGHLGVTDADLHGTFEGLNRASVAYGHWSDADEAGAVALAAKVRGTSDVPLCVASTLVRYPTLWKSCARNMRVVWVRKFRRYPFDFDLKQLKKEWDPAMVVALHDLLRDRDMLERVRELGPDHEEEVTRLTDISAVLTTFLAGRGVDVEAVLKPYTR